MTAKPYPPIKDYPDIEPYDPDSPKGKQVAAAMTRVLDDIAIEIAARKELAKAAAATARQADAA